MSVHFSIYELLWIPIPVQLSVCLRKLNKSEILHTKTCLNFWRNKLWNFSPDLVKDPVYHHKCLLPSALVWAASAGVLATSAGAEVSLHGGRRHAGAELQAAQPLRHSLGRVHTWVPRPRGRTRGHRYCIESKKRWMMTILKTSSHVRIQLRFKYRDNGAGREFVYWG